MDMEFLSKDNENHKVVFQHMNRLPLLLLSSQFYLTQLMRPIKNHSNKDFLDSKPENEILNLLNARKQKNDRPQIHLNYVNQYLIQQYK
jgi:hypothetical protein